VWLLPEASGWCDSTCRSPLPSRVSRNAVGRFDEVQHGPEKMKSSSAAASYAALSRSPDRFGPAAGPPPNRGAASKSARPIVRLRAPVEGSTSWIARPLSSTSHREWSRTTSAVPSPSLIETDDPTNGEVRIVRSSCSDGLARAVPAEARVPTIATVTEIARCFPPERRRARERPMARAGALTGPTYGTFRGGESSI
jgi:hypothetical protein